VGFEDDTLSVAQMDGRTISVPLALDRAAIKRRLMDASQEQRANWEIAGTGYGVHWPDIDEDLSTEGLLRGAPAIGALGRKARFSERADTICDDEDARSSEEGQDHAAEPILAPVQPLVGQ
jgi:hypothetical protein